MKHHQQFWLRYLLSVALLLGIFSFSGYNNRVYQPTNRVIQTELVDTKRARTSETISFTDFLVSSNGCLSFYLSQFETSQLLQQHDRLARLKLKNTTRQYLSNKRIRLAFHIINITPTSEEVPLLPLF